MTFQMAERIGREFFDFRCDNNIVEALLTPEALQLFQPWGISIHNLCRSAVAHRDNQKLEIGLLLENGDSAIIGKAHEQMLIEFIDDLLIDLDEFYYFFPKYKGYRLYGAVAGLDLSLDVIRYATRRGLFVLSVNGNDTVRLVNDVNFTPRNFGQ